MHQIRYFLAVAETLNFTRAAEDCNVSQPSLSQAVRKLEEELGGDLFRRERGHSHLTELGRTMQPLLRQCYQSAAAAKAQASSFRSADYAPLRVGVSETVPGPALAPMLGELARAYPGLALHLRRGPATDLLTALKGGDLEIVVAAETGDDWERLDRWPLFEEGLALLVGPGHPLAKRKKVTLAEVLEAGLIGRPHCESTPAITAEAARRNLELAGRHESNSEADAVALAESGLGGVLLPEVSARTMGRRLQPVEDLELKRSVAVYGVAGRQRSAVASGLVQLLRTADWDARPNGSGP